MNIDNSKVYSLKSSSLTRFLPYTCIHAVSFACSLQPTLNNIILRIRHICIPPPMNSTPSPDTTKMHASVGAEVNDNKLFFVDLDPTPIAPTLPYPALARKNEIIDLTNESETEQTDLIDDVSHIPNPPKTPGKHTPGKGQITRSGTGFRRLKINVTSPSTSQTAHQKLVSKNTKKKVIKSQPNVNSTSSLEIISSAELDESILKYHRDISPDSRACQVSPSFYALY